MLHLRLAVLLNTRRTDVFSLELDKQKKHSSRGVSFSCPGKDYLLAIRGTHVDSHKSITPVYPESNSLGNKDCIECYHLQFIFKCRISTLGCSLPPHRKESDHMKPGPDMMPGAIEPGLGLNNVISFYLLFCPRFGNTWTSR
ncbi:hypothetical protein AVEN_268879-1 [Araneus ventricosus]|uniref:Uncharacterized protein n=1 Tax=Araneus ventricosus TaxID=182803 RepID=A0A4Y2EYK6_ARAVE|nr:hypothetical protein AVEN_268879-1 [Araneus ventricosus]